MKKILSFLIILSVCLSIYIPVYSQGEYIGTTAMKDNLVFINNNSIPAAQLPNQFVYLPVELLEYHGFDVSSESASGKKVYTVSRNEEKSVFPTAATAAYYPDTNVYTTDAQVYIDSDIPANVFELENGTVLVQSDELAKYGKYDWSAETHTISIDFANKMLLPSGQPFNNALGIDDINDIAYGTMVLGKNRCADIESEDLKKWLNTYWNFYCDRVIAPMVEVNATDYYIKLWNKDKTKSYTVYNQGIMVGSFGAPYESHGEMKRNYVWYMPYIGNARNALYNADMTLYHKYFDKSYEEYTGTERSFTPQDENDIPSDEKNLLTTNGCSEWAKPEIQKAAAANLLLYELTDKYTQNITRLDFCKLADRLIATEFTPKSDSRLRLYSARDRIVDEKGLRESFLSAKFTDCDYEEVRFLAAVGIIQGMGDGTFAPDSTITREQAATILYRMAEFLGNKTLIQPKNIEYYNDEDTISDWAEKAVKSMNEMGIMKGISSSHFSPCGTYTVEQAVATMVRLYECE